MWAVGHFLSDHQDGGGVELDDFDLETIKTRGLKYRFDQYERNRYESVRVDYKRAAAGGNGKVANDNNLGGSSRTDSILIDNRQPNRFFPVPAPEYFTPGDQNFMGPAMQQLRGRVEGARVQQVLREILGD